MVRLIYCLGCFLVLLRRVSTTIIQHSPEEPKRVYFPVALSLILSAHCIIGLLQLYGVMNSYHSYFKVTGMFFNPAPYSGFLIALSPLCIATYLEMKRGMGSGVSYAQGASDAKGWGVGNKIAANLLLGSFLLTLLVLPVTQSRAAWVAFAGAMAFLVWRYYPVKEMWRKYFSKTTWMKASAISLVAVLMVSSALGLYYYKKDSADGRLLIWKVSADVIKENPRIWSWIGKIWRLIMGKHRLIILKQVVEVTLKRVPLTMLAILIMNCLGE